MKSKVRMCRTESTGGLGSDVSFTPAGLAIVVEGKIKSNNATHTVTTNQYKTLTHRRREPLVGGASTSGRHSLHSSLPLVEMEKANWSSILINQ